MGNKIDWDEVIHRARAFEGTVEHLKAASRHLEVSLESANRENQEFAQRECCA